MTKTGFWSKFCCSFVSETHTGRGDPAPTEDIVDEIARKIAEAMGDATWVAAGGSLKDLFGPWEVSPTIDEIRFENGELIATVKWAGERGTAIFPVSDLKLKLYGKPHIDQIILTGDVDISHARNENDKPLGELAKNPFGIIMKLHCIERQCDNETHAEAEEMRLKRAAWLQVCGLLADHLAEDSVVGVSYEEEGDGLLESHSVQIMFLLGSGNQIHLTAKAVEGGKVQVNIEVWDHRGETLARFENDAEKETD